MLEAPPLTHHYARKHCCPAQAYQIGVLSRLASARQQVLSRPTTTQHNLISLCCAAVLARVDVHQPKPCVLRGLACAGQQVLGRPSTTQTYVTSLCWAGKRYPSRSCAAQQVLGQAYLTSLCWAAAVLRSRCWTGRSRTQHYLTSLCLGRPRHEKSLFD